MALPLFETENFAFYLLRVGATIVRKADNASVYFQPGDDTSTINDNVEALEEVSDDKRATIFDMICAEYLD